MTERHVADARIPGAGLKLYYLHPLLAGPVASWPGHFARIAALGFTHVLVAPPFAPAGQGSLWLSATHDALHPALEAAGSALSALSALSSAAARHGLVLLLDCVLDRVANNAPLAEAHLSPFLLADRTLDPRLFDPDGDAARAPLATPAEIARLADFWAATFSTWEQSGIGGIRIASMASLPPKLIAALRPAVKGLLLGNAASLPAAARPAFAAARLDGLFSSLPWWDGESDWYWREHASLSAIAPVLTCSEAPFGARVAEQESDPARHLALALLGLNQAATFGAGWMLTMGAEYATRHRLDARRDTPAEWHDMSHGPTLIEAVQALNEMRSEHPAFAASGTPHLLTGGGTDLLAFLRPAAADIRAPAGATLVALANRPGRPVHASTAHLFANAGGYTVIDLGEELRLPPEGLRVLDLEWNGFEDRAATAPRLPARKASQAPRIAIENVSPTVDGGLFPARYCINERVTVEADLICDGHDILAAIVRHRSPSMAAGTWQEAPLHLLGNDRWAGSFVLTCLGIHEFAIEVWKDVYATYRDELTKKFVAGLDVTLEIEEGRLLVEAAAKAKSEARHTVAGIARAVAQEPGAAAKVALLLSDHTAVAMREADQRAFATWTDPAFRIEAERTAARFASWYELFPRSMSGRADRHGTFDDVIAQLPRVQSMGFDVLYFPPIHPIGIRNRKGRNNALTAGENDPGSPYGISDHRALHEELGTFADFARLRDAALAHGLELALDFAVQCAPDHPWLKSHPGWFDWRPDGSIRYAENPPKKYQDIVNVDFYKPEAVHGLWNELYEVVAFWCTQGVRIFRVDNPHTKPLPFWHWLITEIRARWPDTLFLAEAFTKPKMMNRLAKIGFSQSYTYFTWRNTPAELREYLTELTTTAAKEFFRPNFFVNTPDINPVFLQNSGRAGHLIRAALAATLAGLWGVYSGFELCEATPVPGREDYLDSEKYEIRVWDWDRPGNIVAEITRLNWIRRLNPALQTHLGITFLEVSNDNVLYFEKATGDRDNVILVAISLDPHTAQECRFELPLWRWKLHDHAALQADDLLHDTRYIWQGKTQHVRLDPASLPYAIWRVRPL